MLNVLLASDNNYASLLLIALTSFLEHNKKDFNYINIYIFDDGINEENKKKINDLTEKYPCNLTFIKTKKLDSLDMNIMALDKEITGTSLTTYSRLFMATLLPKEINKILYIDCDALILGSYKKLWKLNINDYYCAGVLDTLNENVKKLYGYDESDAYINAGFLLVNLEKWRNDHVEEKFLEFLSTHQGEYFVHDQGVINKVFRDKIKIVEPKYNLQLYFQYLDYNLAKKLRGIEKEYYSKEIVDESRENPVFVHFCGGEYERPWYNENHYYNKEFLKYAKMAGCEDVINYIAAPSLQAKLLHKGSANKFINMILKMIPAKIAKKVADDGGILDYERNKQKAIESVKK